MLSVVLFACSRGGGNGEERAGPTGQDVVELDSAALAAADIAFDSVRVVTTSVLSTTGMLTYDANAVARVGPKSEGRIVRVLHDLGDRVDDGAWLAVLESQELGDLRAERAQAEAAADLERQTYEREQRLYERRVSSEQELLAARAAYESASAELAAAEAKLRTLGGLEEEGTGFVVSSPLTGTVVQRDAVIGQITGPEDLLFTVADLTRLWLVVDVYEKDLARVAAGQHVDLRVQAFGDTAFPGTIGYVGQVVDPESHTVKARVVVENPDGLLRPGMFAQAGIATPEPPGTLAVLTEAVQELRGSKVVFVAEAPGRFRPVLIQTGQPLHGDLVLVTSGLRPGQRIVGRGSFILKSELLKATFGDID